MKKQKAKQYSLLHKSMVRFIVFTTIMFTLAIPLFYWLTKNYYAEDMKDIIEAVQNGQSIPEPDLETDVMIGITIQYLLITTMLGIGVVLTMRFISKKLWAPFDDTLTKVESFSLEKGGIPLLPKCDILEFTRLNNSLERFMHNCVDSYNAQKEFTENASHELQTPLAIFQGKLDLLLQQPELTKQQAEIIQELYQMTSRLSRLNRNLLLLAKIDNAQFAKTENINLNEFIDDLLPYLESIADGLHIEKHLSLQPTYIKANRSLLESMINNLVVNAVRHNRPCGIVNISVKQTCLVISNTSEEPALDTTHIFNRFYRPTQNKQGNGLGLAIVKAVCNYHNWEISYSFKDMKHCFMVQF